MKTAILVQWANPAEEGEEDRSVLVAYSDATSEVVKMSKIEDMAGDGGQARIDYWVAQKTLFESIKQTCLEL